MSGACEVSWAPTDFDGFVIGLGHVLCISLLLGRLGGELSHGADVTDNLVELSGFISGLLELYIWQCECYIWLRRRLLWLLGLYIYIYIYTSSATLVVSPKYSCTFFCFSLILLPKYRAAIPIIGKVPKVIKVIKVTNRYSRGARENTINFKSSLWFFLILA